MSFQIDLRRKYFLGKAQSAIYRMAVSATNCSRITGWPIERSLQWPVELLPEFAIMQQSEELLLNPKRKGGVPSPNYWHCLTGTGKPQMRGHAHRLRRGFVAPEN
jgi:hypothetical protein